MFVAERNLNLMKLRPVFDQFLFYGIRNLTEKSNVTNVKNSILIFYIMFEVLSHMVIKCLNIKISHLIFIGEQKKKKY